MYKFRKPPTTSINNNNSYQGETLEVKIQRLIENKEPIGDAAPLIYQERSAGIQPDFNIRTDKWEHAAEAMDKAHRLKLAKREAKVVKMAKGDDKPDTKSDAKTEGGQSDGLAEPKS